MTVRLLVVAFLAAAASACLDFKTQVQKCRNDAGVWLCGDGGQTTDAGTLPKIPRLDAGWCEGAWCWENALPSSRAITAIAFGPSGLVIANEAGMIAEQRGDGFALSSIPDFQVRTMCFAGDRLFVGGRTDITAPDIFVRVDGGWVGAMLSAAANQFSCSGSGVDIAATNGFWHWDPPSAPTHTWTAPLTAFECVGVTSTATTCVGACLDGQSPSRQALVMACDGTGQTPLGIGTTDSMSALWPTNDGGVVLALNGGGTDLYQLQGTSWGVVQSVSGDVSSGVAVGADWVAVGESHAITKVGPGPALPDINDPDKPGNRLNAIAALPGGGLVTGGNGGDLFELDRANNRWNSLTPGNTNQLYALTTRNRIVAVGGGGTVLERTDAGWEPRSNNGVSGDFIGVWETSDGGLAMITQNTLEAPWLNSISLGVAADLAGLDDRHVFVATDQGVVEINLETGGRLNSTTESFSVLSADRATSTVYGAGQSGVWRSIDGGSWVALPAGPTGISDISFGFGSLWVSGGSQVSEFFDGGWQVADLGWNANNVIAIDERTAVVLDNELMWVVTPFANGLGTKRGRAPGELFSVSLRGGELWAVGPRGAVVRLKLSDL